jgi:hypothetical protein
MHLAVVTVARCVDTKATLTGHPGLPLEPTPNLAAAD